MELKPLTTPNTFPELGLLPPPEPFGTLNRLLKRSIEAMRGTPDFVHFLEPVSPGDISRGDYHPTTCGSPLPPPVRRQ
ncbi:unnamed protein product [Ascophyllum nodosum]